MLSNQTAVERNIHLYPILHVLTLKTTIEYNKYNGVKDQTDQRDTVVDVAMPGKRTGFIDSVFII